MAHYNLYEALNLDRSKPPAEIDAELAQRVEDNQLDNLGGREEVEIARNILGDPQKRTMYDSRLDDPNAPEVDVNALRQLAETNFGAPTDTGSGAHAAPENQPAAPEKSGPSFGDRMKETGERFKETGAKAQEQFAPAVENTKAEFKRSSGKAIGITAVSTAVAMVLIWAVASFAFGGIGGGGTVTGKGAPTKKIDQFLKLRDADKTDEWIRDNIHFKLQDDMIDELDLDGDYRGMDRYIGAEDPKVLYTLDLDDFGRMVEKFDEDRVKRAYEDAHVKNFYFAQIGDKNGRDTDYTAVVLEYDDGKLAIDLEEKSDEDYAEVIEDLDADNLKSSSKKLRED